ncbi:LysR substrate-binding domain-containing protein [Mangrovicoccus ximenensis]|uniref:LysR substrate-binding domain-containing protein n=1 Tax=Mangrovicoccus ximenensis TaxID=1911570 RepID=UPI000D387C89|nr:LysR substrate-binding domain-containing protein [Mangrovicoccus ximenensis]
MRDLNLKATEYFEAVARLGTVTKAAEELAVSPSAVSQQLSGLETQLGVKLFRREKRRLVLTLDGDRLFQTTTQAFGAIRNARSAIAHQRDLRTLTIRVSPSFGVRWLGPRVGAFAAENPDWAIRIDATPDFSSFETETVDLDLRYGLGAWSGLSNSDIMHDLVLPLCSPDYLKMLQAQSPDPAEQLGRARLIDSVKTLFRWDLWLAANRIQLPHVAYPLRFDRSSMSIEMAKQGGGICLESVSLCLGEMERGELVPFFPDFPVLDFSAYWLVCPPRHFSRRIVKRFADWLAAAAEAHDRAARAALTGHGCTFREGAAAELIDRKSWGL